MWTVNLKKRHSAEYNWFYFCFRSNQEISSLLWLNESLSNYAESHTDRHLNCCAYREVNIKQVICVEKAEQEWNYTTSLSEWMNICIMLTYSTATNYSERTWETLLKNSLKCANKLSVIIKSFETSCKHKMNKIMIQWHRHRAW